MSTLLERSTPYFVTLMDRVGTRFQVSAKWKFGLLHLCEGWTNIGLHYKLRFGGWVIMTYADDFLFNIDVRDRSLIKIGSPLPARFYSIGNLGDPIVIDPDEFPLEKFRYHDLTCTRTAFCTSLTFLDLISLVRFFFSISIVFFTICYCLISLFIYVSLMHAAYS